MGSFWTSALGGALAGAGNAAVNLGNKFIDEQLAQQRAQVLADLQVTTAGKIREQDDAFRNDPTRVARDRANRVADVQAEGGARNEVALAGERARATDPALRQATIDTATDAARAAAKAKGEVERDEVVKRGTDPLFLKAQKALKEAERQPESAGSLAQAALARAQLAAIQKVEGLRDQLAEAVATGNKGQEEALREQLAVFESKPGKNDKLRAAIEASEKTVQSAMKVLNDPMASEQARAEAQESVRQARVRMESYTKELGIDASKPKVPESEMHKQAEAAIKAGAPRDAVNARLQEQGYRPLPEMGKKTPKPAIGPAPGALPSVAPPAAAAPLSFRAQQEERRRAAEEAERSKYGTVPPALLEQLQGR